MTKTENKPLTVGELKQLLKDYPDDMEVFLFQIIDESDGKTEFVPLDRDLYLSKHNTLELYPIFGSDLTYK